MLLVLLQSSLTDDKNWPLLGMLILAGAYILLRPMMKRRDPLDRASGFKSLSQQRAVERQMQNLLVDFTEMARTMSAQLDSRAAKLEALIEQADQRLAQLRSAGVTIPSIDQQPRMKLVTDDPPPDPSQTNPDQTDPRHAEVYALADEGRGAGEIAARLNRPSGEIELILALRPRG